MNVLEALEGIRIRALTGNFIMIGSNKIDSFVGCPEFVKGNVRINVLPRIKTLKGLPAIISGELKISGLSGLESLEGFPIKVGKDIMFKIDRDTAERLGFSMKDAPQLDIIEYISKMTGISNNKIYVSLYINY